MIHARNRTDISTAATADLAVPPGYPAWITVDLLAHTQRVWSRQNERELSVEEAAEILASVGRLFEIIAMPTPSVANAETNAS